jgi:hypothetical protein
LAALRAGAVLQRLDAVQHQQRAAPHHRLGDRLTLGDCARRSIP